MEGSLSSSSYWNEANSRYRVELRTGRQRDVVSGTHTVEQSDVAISAINVGTLSLGLPLLMSINIACLTQEPKLWISLSQRHDRRTNHVHVSRR